MKLNNSLEETKKQLKSKLAVQLPIKKFFDSKISLPTVKNMTANVTEQSPYLDRKLTMRMINTEESDNENEKSGMKTREIHRKLSLISVGMSNNEHSATTIRTSTKRKISQEIKENKDFNVFC